MKEDIKERWVDALKSGKYKQGHGYLKYEYIDKTTHCCLGVLCELAVEDGIITPKHGFSKFDFQNEKLPLSVMDWANMKSTIGRFFPTGCNTSISLSALNDNGQTFEEIADIIEQNWEKL